MISCVIGSVVFVKCYSSELVSIFTASKELQMIASSSLNVYASIFILDATQVVMNGVIKGLGIQQEAKNYAFISFFFVGLPSSYMLGIRLEQGIYGLWYGFAIGLFVLNSFYINLITSTNWEDIVISIQKSLEFYHENLEVSTNEDSGEND